MWPRDSIVFKTNIHFFQGNSLARASNEELYNSVSVSLLGKTTISNFDDVQNSFVISVNDVFEAVQKQKKDNAAGFDAVHIKTFVYSGSRLFVHIISLLFNLFIKYCCVPQNVMSFLPS